MSHPSVNKLDIMDKPKNLSPSSSLESELSLDTSSSPPSPTSDKEENYSGNSCIITSDSDSASDAAPSPSPKPEEEEKVEDKKEEETDKMVVKEKTITTATTIITTTRGGNGVIATIPESILNEANLKLSDDSAEYLSRVVLESSAVSDTRLNHHHPHHHHHNQSHQNNKNLAENGTEDHDHHHHHCHHHSSVECSNTLELNNQLNMLERILFPESHHKIITPRITITIDPSMVFDECEEDAESDSDGDGGSSREQRVDRIVVLAEEDYEDDDSSVFLEELSSETGMSDKTLADLEIVEAGDDEDVDDIGVLDDVNGSNSSAGSDGDASTSSKEEGNVLKTTRTPSITLAENGLIITCEKYGKVPIPINDDDNNHSDSSSDPKLENGNGSPSENTTHANQEATKGVAVMENEGEKDAHLNSVTATATENLQQQQMGEKGGDQLRSDANISPTHKLGRASSSPSNTNLSEPSSEPNSESGLKTEEVKPRRRNTIADIFRWYYYNTRKNVHKSLTVLYCKGRK